MADWRGRCAEHNRDNERSIHRAGNYSTKRWDLTRRRQLFEHSICQACGNALATEVHHIKDLRDGGEMWDPDNLASLCHRCHSRVTRASNLGRGGWKGDRAPSAEPSDSQTRTVDCSSDGDHG